MILSRVKSIAGSALIVVAASCATHVAPTTQPVFFPPPPTPPRLQFLTSFSGSKDLERQSSFNRFVAGENQDQKLDKPYGVALWDGRIYVCDTNAGVFVFDLKAKRYGALKGAVGPGKLLQPINVSVDEDGFKYVADPVRGQVVAFDRNDEYVKAYGTPGDWRPVDAVRFADRLYVVDTGHHVVAVLDRESGAQVATIGDRGAPDERLDRPTNISIDRDGALYVTDSGKFQVVKFDRDGRFLAVFGKAGDNLGHFARPKGTALDRDGRLYAVDASFNNVQLFDKGGRLLMFFGDGGEAAGDFLLPAKVTIDYDNVSYFQQYIQPDFQVEYLVLVTNQFGPRLVNVLAYGRAKGQPYPTDEELLKQIEERRRKELEKLSKP